MFVSWTCFSVRLLRGSWHRVRYSLMYDDRLFDGSVKAKTAFKTDIDRGYQMKTITDTHLARLTDKLYFSIYEVNSFCDLIAWSILRLPISPLIKDQYIICLCAVCQYHYRAAPFKAIPTSCAQYHTEGLQEYSVLWIIHLNRLRLMKKAFFCIVTGDHNAIAHCLVAKKMSSVFYCTTIRPNNIRQSTAPMAFQCC